MSDAGHRRMAGNLFNAAWQLLDLESRTPAQEQEMLAAALGSRYHWGRVGTPRHPVPRQTTFALFCRPGSPLAASSSST